MVALNLEAFRLRLGAVLDPLPSVRLRPGDARCAAVLGVFFPRADGIRLVFIRRAELGDTHAGQVAFPGGHLELKECACDAALREANEEVGLDPEDVVVVGALPDIVSIHTVRVTPIFAVAAQSPRLRADNLEVARVFDIAWSDLVGGVGYRRGAWRGHRMHYWDLEGETLWGLTGAMVYRLIERLEGRGPEEAP
jgi:8-oxo-dGTP pyrophosphatase MutT (NUDIX family)